jgi:hypothetical protein
MVRKRPRVEPTDDFQEILPLCWWPEQVEYERIRQPVLFGSPVDERAEETGVSERTLQRRIKSFEKEGMEGLFESERAKRRRLPPASADLSWISRLSIRHSTSTRSPTWSGHALAENPMSAR